MTGDRRCPSPVARAGRAAGLALALAVASAAAAVGEDLRQPDGAVVLEVAGRIERTNREGAAAFDRAMLEALPPARLETTTVVTDGVRRFDGFYMRDLLDRLGAQGETVRASALNDYAIDIPITDFMRFDVVVATHMDGERLEPRGKGPLWIVYPRDDHAELQDLRYDYRWVWQLDRLEVR
ncbi:molybdopterin-dependent oxidoreductase [Aquibium sp. A9E412]|uniref:molybdopterin-dependent oxidoreductase n=1 Tax=Aquibium sp. A9E412 TaxID=2976767 RepID=UPI0025AF11B4|nr:molybdopterin-dependent oxidoreductase [Aquibium sp. A9E412]MDN2565615.1 molybdopterin-dependent oxidoreductase [Aquibium sp. A9E412]